MPYFAHKVPKPFPLCPVNLECSHRWGPSWRAHIEPKVWACCRPTRGPTRGTFCLLWASYTQLTVWSGLLGWRPHVGHPSPIVWSPLFLLVIGPTEGSDFCLQWLQMGLYAGHEYHGMLVTGCWWPDANHQHGMLVSNIPAPKHSISLYYAGHAGNPYAGLCWFFHWFPIGHF